MLQMFVEGDSFPLLEDGTLVRANYRREGEWLDGRILKCNDDGDYHIVYDDGGFVETNVSRDDIIGTFVLLACATSLIVHDFSLTHRTTG